MSRGDMKKINLFYKAKKGKLNKPFLNIGMARD